jgi:hypothetical protein
VPKFIDADFPLGDPITLLDLCSPVIDARQHFGGIAGNHDIDDGWPLQRHRALQGFSELARFLDADPVAAENLGSFRIIGLCQVRGVVEAGAIDEML